MKRALVGLILIASAVGISAQSSISITTLDRTTVPTFGLLAINGNGFDPNAGISIVFTARDAVTATVPAVSASATSVRVAAPPLVNSRSGKLFDTPVVAEVQVVQVTGSSVMTSNTLGGLTIQPASTPSGSTGTFTRDFLRTMVDIQGDLRSARQSTAGYSDVMTVAQAFTDAQRTLIDAINQILANRDVTVNLQTKDNLPMLLDFNSLVATDRLAAAYIQQANEAARGGGAAVSGNCGCTGTTESERLLCEFRRNACIAYDASRRVVPDLALDAYGSALGLIGSWSATGFSSAGPLASETTSGIGFLASQALAYVTAILAGNDPPQLGSMLRDTGSAFVDDFTNSGLGVMSSLERSVQMTQNVGTVVYRNGIQVGPIGGLVTPAPQPANPPSNTRPVNVYVGRQSHYWIATPVNQTVTTLTGATLPPPRAARFDGRYTGTSNGVCTVVVPEGPPVTAGGAGPIAATVSNGVLTADGGGGGTVTETGRFITPAASAGGVSCTAGGLFFLDGSGGAGATGYLSCSGPGVSCAGTWNLARSQ